MKPRRQNRPGPALLLAFCSVVSASFSSAQVLIKEVVSAEYSVSIGGVEFDPPKTAVSREFSIHVENGRDPYPEVVSREYGLIVTDPGAPPVITELTASLSPTGDTAVLDWSGYNQWAVRDIARFDIYFTDAGGFTDISAMTPYRSVPAESTTITLDGLAEFTDHFFAVVAVDALGNFLPTVDYAAAYILSPQVVSREFSVFVGGEPAPPYREIVSREFGLIVADPAPPPALTDVAVTASASGDSVSLDWSSYNQWAVRDIARFDIYLSDTGPFTDVTGMTPVARVPSETTSHTLQGLTPNLDHFLAIVPVDALGNFNPLVNYSAAYVLSPEVVSREFSLFIGDIPASQNREAISRELTILVPDATTPAPVTGVGSGFFAETSTSEFGAVALDWTSYNELAQQDVAAYRIYVGNSFFDDVTGLAPFTTSRSGLQRLTLTGLNGGQILHFAVVAEDIIGNFNPTVRSFSAQASVSGVGEVGNLVATASTANGLTFSWEVPPDSGAFLTGYHLYFAGSDTPVVLPPGITTHQFTGLAPATGYSLRVATLDIFAGESAGVSLLAATLLPNPANLALTLVNGNVVATWSPVAPAPLVRHFAVFLENSAITNTTGLTPAGTTVATSFDLGSLATVMDRHIAVATINLSGGSDPAVTSVQATKAGQTINFPAPTAAFVVPLTATASSGLPVRFQAVPTSLATLTGPPGSEVLTALSGGSVTVTAFQDGNPNFWPAPPVAHVLRLPPVIASFSANGTEIGPGTVLNRIDNLLRVDGRDQNGISQAAFSIRPSGGSFTSLGIDTNPVDGHTANLALDAFPDGAHDLRVEITSALTGQVTSTTRAVTLQLAAPAPPSLTSPTNGAIVTSNSLLVTGQSSREAQVFLERGGVPVAGPLTPAANGSFSATVPLLTGPNLLTARATNRAGAGPNSPTVTVTLRSALTLALNPPSFTEGQSSNLTVTRNHPQGPLTVTLSQNVAGQLQLPPSVSFADGEAQNIVPVSAVDDDVPEIDQGVTITAQAANHNPGSTLATVLDNDRPALTLALNRTVISESDSTGSLTATVTRTPINARSFTVTLHSSAPSAVQASAPLLIAPFIAGNTGPLTVVNDDLLDGDQVATITARIFDVSTGELLAESNAVNVTVTDDDGPSLALKVARDTVQEGANVTATLTRNTGLGQARSVNLAVDRPSQASLPPSVNFAIGQASLTFPVTGLDDGVPDGNQPVLLEATAAGFAPAQAGLIVTDESKPDLVVTVLTAPIPVLTDEWVNYTYRIENQGPVGANGPVSVRVLLSSDPAPGGDTQLNTFTFNSGLPPGLFFERSETFRTPIQAGTYWLIVEVDGENVHPEILESNNTRLSNPMTVGAAYRATVSTNVTVAPSGSPVPFTGTATNVANGSPAAFKLVNVHLTVRDTRRILSTLTDSIGRFSLTFTPLPGEGGSYTVGATHPGVPTAEVQDSFTLLGIGSDTPRLELTATRNEPTAGQLVIRNLANVALSGLQIGASGFPSGITIGGSLPGGATTLGPLAEATVNYQLTANSAAPELATGSLNITSAEGAALAVPLTATVRELQSLLVTEDAPLQAGMIPGSQNFVNFTVRNAGSVPTGPIRLLLPAVSWLSAATASPLPSLPPGQQATVSLQLAPPIGLPLTANNGSLQLAGDHNTLTIPFTFRALASATGDLVVRCEDEYTYFASSTPPLQGATVKVFDAVNGTLLATATSDPDGEASFPALLEGYYKIEASAPDHSTYRETIFLTAGQRNFVRAFLSRQLVRYLWNVVPTQIEDRYRIVVESVFETNVPAPVVTIEPSYIDLRELDQEVTQIDLKITNHGLIAANDVRLNFASTVDWEVTPLASDLGTLAAKSSLTVPLIIRNLSGDFARNGACAVPAGAADWCYVCGTWNVCGGAGITFDANTRDCPGGPVIIPPGSGGSGGAVVVTSTPVCACGVVTCDPCVLRALIDCVIGFAPGPISCPYAIYTNSGGFIDTMQTGIGCICAFTPASPICSGLNCFIDLLQCLAAAPGGGARSRQDYAEILQRFDDTGRGLAAMVDFDLALLGDEAWRDHLQHEAMPAFLALFRDAIQDAGDAGREISPTERAALLATSLVASIGATLPTGLIDRWGRTLAYHQAGILNSDDLPPGFNPDFHAVDVIEDAAARGIAAYQFAFADGFDDPLQAFLAARDDLFTFLSSGGGVCARVRLQIEQEAVMTRDAFAASLDIINDDPAAITGIEVSLRVTDADGVDATALFGVVGPEITGVNGDSVAGESTGSWRWTLIPSQDAAPDAVTEYFVEGSMSYVQDGLTVNVPLLPRQISVHPNPRLFLKYFHERNVYADDPFTDPVEPSIPFSLGVMVENRGAGLARNLRITSAQPEIIENDKGLLIDFEIIASQVDGQNLSPSLTADFGDIPSGETKVARWLLTSTLQGHFTEYDAFFEHIDSLGDERLSLIEEVTIHETIHSLRALGDKDDGLPDFFTNDVFDVRDLGDTVHLSDGTTAPVRVVETGTFGTPTAGNLTVTLNAPAMGAGWSYLRLADPGAGAFRVVRVTRSDGREIPLDLNAWTTDRTFIGFGLRPVPEHIFHLVDCDSTGSYSVEYAVIPPPDSTPPTSAVNALPAQSGAFIDLSWTGNDAGGIAFFDIHFSANGGPFQLWLARTTATSALFTGSAGNNYAFHSIATDRAGLEEPSKSAGEAQTTVSLFNQPPSLAAIANQNISEGATFRHRAAAFDSDGPNALLRYSLSSNQPGLVIDPVTGWMTWVTGEQNGGTSVEVTVTVTDGDPAPLSASRLFTISVQDTNAAPVLQPPGRFTIDVGQQFQIQLSAEDGDIPAQVLRYHLVGAPPFGLVLDPVSGLLTWTPADAHEDQSFEILLEARDDQIPAGVGRATLFLDVLKKPGLPPAFDAFPLLVWPTEGQFFQEIIATDPEGEPVTISGGLSDLTGWVAFRTAPGTGRAVLEWNTTGVPPGVYEVPLSARTTRQQTDTTLAIEVVSRPPFLVYQDWIETFPLDLVDHFELLDPNGDDIPNLLAYGLGVDPAHGPGTVQPNPRPVPFLQGLNYGLAFTMPTNGRFDLRYVIEGSSALLFWNELARKEGNAPWTGATAVTLTPLRDPLSRASVLLPRLPERRFSFLRLRVEVIAP